MKSSFATPLLAVLVLAPIHVRGLTLYETEFEEFNAGPDQWAGTNGWSGSSNGLGVHGIDEDILPGLGKTAYLGFNTPATDFVTVFHAVAYDPVTNGTPFIEFETLMGIEDSTNGFRDTFFVSFYNTQGDLMAAVQFDNTELNFGIWRFDGVTPIDTGIDFIRGELHLLRATIDFAGNTWAADLDGIPLFAAAPFSKAGVPLDLGFVAAEWQLTEDLPTRHGNNWLLVADWAVRAFFKTEDIGLSTNRVPAISWQAAAGYDYLMEYSDDLEQWFPDTPGGLYTNVMSSTQLVFMADGNTTSRCYRIQRISPP